VLFGKIRVMKKVILYYKFVPVNDPHITMLWQRELCSRLNLKGRIIISKHGINGTLGGELVNLRRYKQEMNASEVFRGIPYKWSKATGDEFPKLSIKVRSELVAFNRPDEIKVDENGIVGGGTHLKPEEVHKLVKEKGDDVVFFDGRNAYEAKVGKFKNAVIPNTNTTHDFVDELESGKYDDIKDKPVVTYCTGGVRCEILSALMKKRGFKQVYQMDGGVVEYGEKYGDDGLWEGNLYIFDGRMTHKFSDKAKDIGECSGCGEKTSNFINCEDKKCDLLMLVCKKCAAKSKRCETYGLVRA
jgi:UPF0176 protein